MRFLTLSLAVSLALAAIGCGGPSVPTPTSAEQEAQLPTHAAKVKEMQSQQGPPKNRAAGHHSGS